jgi:hypothetical protein
MLTLAVNAGMDARPPKQSGTGTGCAAGGSNPALQIAPRRQMRCATSFGEGRAPIEDLMFTRQPNEQQRCAIEFIQTRGLCQVDP